MRQKAGKFLRSLVRWTIAIVGIVWICTKIHLSDRVNVLDDRLIPRSRQLVQNASEDSAQFVVKSDAGNETVDRSRVINPPDGKTVTLNNGTIAKLLGANLRGDLNKQPQVDALLIEVPGSNPPQGQWIAPADLKSGYKLNIPNPRVEQGAINMVANSNTWLLLLAIMIAPTNYIITTIRWRRLLQALLIEMPLIRVFTLNMVGSFYNSFMPGSTGGDVIKAYYAAKSAPNRRTYAVMSVMVDRVIGLIMLVILGGIMASVQYLRAPDRTDPVAIACLRVAMVSGTMLLGGCVSLWLFFHPDVRRFRLFRWAYERLPAKEQLHKVGDAMDLYRQRPGLMLWALLISAPVHTVTIISTMLAGMAFGLPLSSGYYFIVVPVVVLVGAIPISPQGVGVMEYFAYYLTARQGATVNQALAITMSIRLIAMLWNLTGGLFVLRGGFHAPTETEERELEATPVAP